MAGWTPASVDAIEVCRVVHNLPTLRCEACEKRSQSNRIHAATCPCRRGDDDGGSRLPPPRTGAGRLWRWRRARVASCGGPLISCRPATTGVRAGATCPRGGGSHGSGTWIAANVAGSAGACSHMHWQMTGVMVALPQTDLADNRPIFGAISGAPVWCALADWWPSGRRWAFPPRARRALWWYRPPRNARRPIVRFSGIGMVGARPAQTGVPSGGTWRGRRGDAGGP